MSGLICPVCVEAIEYETTMCPACGADIEEREQVDPNANIEEQRKLAAEIVEMMADCRCGNIDMEKPQRLAELVDALDGWLVSGGFLPKRWEANR